jgi:Domain of unknown function (DUF4157)
MQRRLIQRKAKGKPQARPSKVKIPESGGRGLGADQQQRMEEELGADLSGVRIHDGGASAQAANELGARAFTVGQDIHFNDGELKPGTLDGDRLLAHELAHTVQGQRSGGVQRKASVGAGDLDGVSHPEDACEKEADAAADHAVGGLHGGARAAGKPAIGAAAPSVGRKLFGSKKSDPAPAAAGGAQAAAPGGKAAPAAAGATPAAKAPSGNAEEQKAKQEEVKKQKQLLKMQVDLAAKEAGVIQQVVGLLVASAQDIITFITGPLGSAAGTVIGSILKIVQGGSNMFLDIKREMDVVAQGKIIDDMTPEQLEEYCQKWEKDQPSLNEIKEQLTHGQEEVKEVDASGDKEKEKTGVGETLNKNKVGTAMKVKTAGGMVGAGVNIAKVAGGEQIKQGVVGKVMGMIPGVNSLMALGSLAYTCVSIARMHSKIRKLQEELGIVEEPPTGAAPPPGQNAGAGGGHA